MRCAVLLLVIGAALASNPWVRVPGGMELHRSCIHEVPDNWNGIMPAHEPCKYPARYVPANEQIYAMDSHFSTSTKMTSFNCTMSTPNLPTKDQGQILFFWPGFKSTAPTMGLPVLQPVLQYGSNGWGGGRYWCVRSWYVYGDIGEAYVSKEVKLQPGDEIPNYMEYNEAKKLWTIWAKNGRTGEETVLTETYAKVHNTDFKVAMLVLETIMAEKGYCPLYPTNPITFSKVYVDGKVAPWEDRITKTDCAQAITHPDAYTTVFNYHN